MSQQEIQGSDWLERLNDNFDELYAATLTTPPASNAEAQAKAATDRAVTPANLAAIGASTSFAGLVELATSAETITGTDTARAVTPKGLADSLAAAVKRGKHTVSAGEETAGQVDIATGLAAASAMIVQVYRAGVIVTADAVVTLAGGTLGVADGAGTYGVSEGDVINWIVF